MFNIKLLYFVVHFDKIFLLSIMKFNCYDDSAFKINYTGLKSIALKVHSSCAIQTWPCTEASHDHLSMDLQDMIAYNSSSDIYDIYMITSPSKTRP